MQLEERAATGLETEAEWDSYNRIQEVLPPGARGGCNLTHAVYGWHPYWMGTAYNSYDWDALSTLSYFSYELNPTTGNYNSIHAWRTTNAVTLAQAAGTRVELCVTNFGGSNNTTFLTNPTAQQTFIDSLISLLAFRNADGVNIDFEGVPGSQRNNLSNFVQNMSTQLKAARPGSTVSMALYAVDWNNVFDMPALDPHVDQFIIMGYDYYYSGSANAGPTAPLYAGSIWWSYNLNRTILYYLDQGVTPSKLLLGLPYFGMEWYTASNTYPAAQTGYISSRTFSYGKNNYEGTYPKTHDLHSMSNAYIYADGAQYRQSWLDDEWSLGYKMDIVRQRGIGGMGIWALGYDNGYNDLWNMIRDKFGDCGSVYCSDTLYDTGGPLGNHRNNEDYAFTIQSPAGQPVRASFPSFDLESNYDYLYVYDGPSTASPLLGQFDGNVAPGPFVSTGDALTFRFTSDGATVRSGFSLAWACEGPSFYPDTIYLDHSDSALIDCGQAYHVFYDSDLGAAGDYSANEDETMTFCAADPAQALRLTFDMDVAPVQLDLKSTAQGNDYLGIFDGPSTASNPVALYTGSTSSYPQPGTILSSGQCLTARFQSDAFLNGAGWAATIRCSSPATDMGTAFAPTTYFDSGGPTGDYANNERRVWTFCPTAADLAQGRGVHADFGAVALERNYDYLQVYDGSDRNAPLIGTFTGNDLDQNNLQIIKATKSNPSGCLTFAFTSDGATTRAGWAATIRAGNLREAYGNDDCSSATLINQGGVPYAGSTTLAKGLPGNPDPPLNISLASLPECSGTNEITRLENTIWYRFSTPSTICPNSQIDLALENIACQNSIPGGNGAQLVIYEAVACENGPAWGSPVYCSDKLLQSFPVNIAGLLQPSRTYYILIDGFAGQHCNLDLILSGDLNGCILPIELVHFEGTLEAQAVELSWETGHEENNSGFYIQRGIQLAGAVEFQDIGFVASAAAANGAGSYGFSDPAYHRGQTNYYRLRQVDLEGKVHYHKVIQVRDGAAAFEIYPNPSTGALTISGNGTAGQASRIEMYDGSGRRVYAAELRMEQGRAEIDISSLPRGIYHYMIQSGSVRQGGSIIRE